MTGAHAVETLTTVCQTAVTPRRGNVSNVSITLRDSAANDADMATSVTPPPNPVQVGSNVSANLYLKVK